MTTQNTVTAIPFSEICEPGTYVCNWSGHLLQIPTNAINGNAPWMNLWGNDTPCVTKISNDWNVSIEDARTMARDCGCTVNF